MSNDELKRACEEVLELDADATPGEWASGWDLPDDAKEKPIIYSLADLGPDDREVVFEFFHDGPLSACREIDAKLIARYRTLAPLLAREVERLAKENATLSAAVRAAGEAWDARRKYQDALEEDDEDAAKREEDRQSDAWTAFATALYPKLAITAAAAGTRGEGQVLPPGLEPGTKDL